ncbi:unnamed protein product [Heligmosomoides polygyrus]|uniref:Uncharacterized protein n=1 Tax=Heligmosomoides polygyrus TaxID=6339 RepID=A0A183FW31_HELPZ|nr:unnamed protein product [Heligmosomoides polygyrus]
MEYLLEKELRMMLSDVANEHQNPIVTSLLKQINSESVTRSPKQVFSMCFNKDEIPLRGSLNYLRATSFPSEVYNSPDIDEGYEPNRSPIWDGGNAANAADAALSGPPRVIEEGLELLNITTPVSSQQGRREESDCQREKRPRHEKASPRCPHAKTPCASQHARKSNRRCGLRIDFHGTWEHQRAISSLRNSSDTVVQQLAYPVHCQGAMISGLAGVVDHVLASLSPLRGELTALRKKAHAKEKPEVPDGTRISAANLTKCWAIVEC